MNDKERNEVESTVGNGIHYLHTLDSYHTKNKDIYLEIQKTAEIVLTAVNQLIEDYDGRTS